MLQHPINVLVVAEDEQVTRAMEGLLQEIDPRGFYLRRVVGLENAIEALTQGRCDLCLLDITPPLSPGGRLDDGYTRQRLSAWINQFIKEVERADNPLPLVVLADEAALGCGDDPAYPQLAGLPTLHLDRNRLTPYTLERAMCFALERAHYLRELNELRVIDPLTGLLYQRSMDSLIAQELQRSLRYRYPVAIISLRVNDISRLYHEHGLALVNEIHRWIGMMIYENIRTVDRSARYNGDEFLVLLPETPAQAAVTVAKRLQLRVATRPFVLFPSQGPVVEMELSISAGIAEGPKDSESPTGLVACAQRALKEARRQKHSRIVVYGEYWPA
jgi:diguanylate cyclase (GGDEF)-like protein